MSDEGRHIPLSVPIIGERERAYVDDCLETGWVSTAGEYVTRFEQAVMEVTGARHAVACQSGTAALHVSLQVAGVERGDEVVVPTLTFIATANAVSYLGAHPVFVDCDAFMNMDPRAVRDFLESECERVAGAVIDRATGRRVSAILPVHVFGNPCDIASLVRIAQEWGLLLIEDAAESLGASWTAGPSAGQQTGTIGIAGCLSFNGNKIITTGGGGIVLTEDRQFADSVRHLTTQAKTDPVRFVHDQVGYNYRMTNVQAAMGLGQVESLRERIERKRRNLDLYRLGLDGIPGIEILGSPEGTAPNYWFYSALVDEQAFGLGREGLMEGLARAGIQSRPVWRLNPLQEPYRGERAPSIERASWFADRVLNLPCTHTLEAEEIEYVCDTIRDLGRHA